MLACLRKPGRYYRTLAAETAYSEACTLPPRFRPGLAWWALHALYQAAWAVALPAALAWLWHRGTREPLYRKHWAERLGGVPRRSDRPLWMHAASLGEIRGISPLLRRLLEQEQRVVLSTLTPAGREAVRALFGPQCDRGTLCVVYAPLDLGLLVRRFVARVRPRCLLVVENDSWPGMLATASRMGLPVAMINAQYSQQSVQRDQRLGGYRSRMFQAYGLVLCKSPLQAERFVRAGSHRVEVAGETRFDLPLATAQVQAGEVLRARLAPQGPQAPLVVAFVSVVAGEDAVFIGAMQALLATAGARPIRFVYVPRSPHRFEESHRALRAAGLSVARRRECLDEALAWKAAQAPERAQAQVLLGDSLGEMYFYLALADVVVVGGSFMPQGAHNVIEPLSLHKPVIVGPHIWTIEFPGVEALQAEAMQQVADEQALRQQLQQWLAEPELARRLSSAGERFHAQHRGATERHLAWLREWMPPA